MSKTYKNFTTAELKDERQKLIDEINYLADKMSEAKLEAVKVKSLKNELDDLSVKEKEAKQKLKVVSDKIFEAETELGKKVGAIKESEFRLEQLGGQEEERFGMLGAAQAQHQEEIEKNSKELTRLAGEKASLESVIYTLAKQQVSLVVEVAKMEDEKHKVTQDKNALDLILAKAKKEFADLEEEIERTKTIHGKLVVENSLLVKKVDSLNKELDSLSNKKKIEEQRIAELSLAFEKKSQDQQVEFEKREGDLSLRESWLKEKEESLRSVKLELEKFHGKKLPIHI